MAQNKTLVIKGQGVFKEESGKRMGYLTNIAEKLTIMQEKYTHTHTHTFHTYIKIQIKEN